jgi:ClpP class serine protease
LDYVVDQACCCRLGTVHHLDIASEDPAGVNNSASCERSIYINCCAGHSLFGTYSAFNFVIAMKIIPHILEKVFHTPWLITAGGYQSVLTLVNAKLAEAGDIETYNPINNLSSANLTLTTTGTGAQPYIIPMEGSRLDWAVDSNGIAKIPVRGVLGQRLSSLEKVCGATDYLDIQQATDDALKRNAKGILYQFDSSGGMVRGCEDLAHHISNLPVPTQAYTDSRCNSAAYWLASACNEIMASSSSDVGSIGVILPWVDKAKVWEVEGLKYEPFTNDGADLKAAGSGPSLTDTQKRYLQESVNYVGEKFQQFVSNNRDVKPVVFKAGTYFGDQAIKVGLIDGVGSYDDAYKALLTRVKNGDRVPVPTKIQVKAKMTIDELKVQHPELYETLIRQNEDVARAAQEAAKSQERNRLADLDALAFTPECKAVVDAAKSDGRTAEKIGAEIAKLLAKENEHLRLQVGVYRGAKPASDVASVDPTMDDKSSEQQLVGRLTAAFQKRYAKNGRN